MREAIDRADGLGDQVTVDTFVGATRAIEKLRWMVRAHRPEPETVGERHGNLTGFQYASVSAGAIATPLVLTLILPLA